MAWVPDIASIVTLRATGGGDMGDLADSGSIARFSLPVSRWALCFVRIHFSGGSGTANCDLTLDCGDTSGDEHDTILMRFPSVGAGVDVNFLLGEGDYEAWWFGRNDDLVLTWTNPSTTYWGATVGLAPVVLP